MSTIILDKKTKDRLLQDINDYLRPNTRKWYLDHGVPYRRGYLFSGAPGTGKAPLSLTRCRLVLHPCIYPSHRGACNIIKNLFREN
jgi:hypothetical protein